MGLTASFPRNQDIACWIFNFPSNFVGITSTIADCRYGNVTGEHSAPKEDYPESCQTQKKTCSSRDVHWRKRVPNTNAATGRCRCRYFSRTLRWLISLPFRLNAQKISARVRSHIRTKTQRGRLRARMGGCVLQEEEMMRRWHGNCNDNDEWMMMRCYDGWMNVHIIIIIRHIIRGSQNKIRCLTQVEKKSRENIGIINYKICTLNFICTCRIHHLIEMIRKDPLANLFFVCERYNPTTVTADAPTSRIDKKKSSPENCIFFLLIRFHLTLSFKSQRRNACPIILLSRNPCIKISAFFQL